MKCRNVFQSLQCQFYYKRCRNCLIIMLSLCTCYAHNLTVYQKICTPLLIFPYINIIPKTWINLYSSFFFGVYCILAGLSVYLFIYFFCKVSFLQSGRIISRLKRIGEEYTQDKHSSQRTQYYQQFRISYCLE